MVDQVLYSYDMAIATRERRTYMIMSDAFICVPHHAAHSQEVKQWMYVVHGWKRWMRLPD